MKRLSILALLASSIVTLAACEDSNITVDVKESKSSKSITVDELITQQINDNQQTIVIVKDASEGDAQSMIYKTIQHMSEHDYTLTEIDTFPSSTNMDGGIWETTTTFIFTKNDK